MPKEPNEKRTRGRIGLTLAPDVMDILDEHGRTVDAAPDDKRPTRTEIIEDAVRQWHLDETLGTPETDAWWEAQRERSQQELAARQNGAPLDRSTERINDADELVDALRIRKEKYPDAPDAVVVRALPLERKQVKPYPKPRKRKESK